MRTAIKRITALLLCLLVVLSVGSVFAAAQDKNTAPQSLRDIPGITEEEVAAIEALQELDKTFTLVMNYSAEAFYNQDGEVDGFSRLFCEEMGALLGLSFEPIVRDWDDLISGLNDLSIDFSGELTKTPARLETYYMTNPIAERVVQSFRLRTSLAVSEIAQTRELRYAFFEGSTTYEDVVARSPYRFVTVYVDSYDEALALLRSKKIDAFFDENTAQAAFAQYEEIAAADFFPLIYSPVSLSTVNPAYECVINVMNRYLANGGLDVLNHLYADGQVLYTYNRVWSSFNEAERAYINAHNTEETAVPVALESDNYPICFYNKKENEYQGIVIDILSNITDITGLRFTPIDTENNSFSELLNALYNGEATMISELIYTDSRTSRV